MYVFRSRLESRDVWKEDTNRDEDVGGDLDEILVGDLLSLLRKPSSRPSFHFVKGERDLSRKPCGGGGGRRAAVRANPGGGEG